MAATDEYLENDVLTASPHRLHLLVVEGAIRFALQGEMAIADRHWEGVEYSLQRARNCLTELIGAINVQHAPEIAEQQRSLFFFAYRNLVMAEMSRDTQLIQDAVRILRIHRDAWAELGQQLQSSGPAATAEATRIPVPHFSSGRTWVT